MHASASVPILLVSTLALVGCTADPNTDGPGTETDTLRVVTSIDVYGDIARTVAGDAAEVSSIISGSVQDPHSYEATARDQLAISRADLVIENGGGYDAFMDTLLDASGSSALVLSASAVSGLIPAAGSDDLAGDDHADGDGGHDRIAGFNEHVWYSFDAMRRLAEKIAELLAGLDPENAGAFESNLADFLGELDALDATADELRDAAAGGPVAITEPVPLYLFQAVGLVDVTPEAFSQAVEEGDDVAPAVLQQMLQIIVGGDLVLLAYNSQTAGPETELVADAAREAGVPIVEFTESLPEGADYSSWMAENLDAIRAALTA